LPCASACPVGRMGPNGKQPDYGDPSRRIATRFRAGYEILFTRRLTPEPEFEVNAHGRSDPVRRDAQLCLHLLRGTPAIFDRPWVAGTRI
jgi:hypothetical protein